MKLKYRGRQKGWRLTLWKGAIQIDFGGKSPKLGLKVCGFNCWDEEKQGFVYTEIYNNKGKTQCSTGIDYFQEGFHISSDLLYVNKELGKTGCNDEFTCEGYKHYRENEKFAEELLDKYNIKNGARF